MSVSTDGLVLWWDVRKLAEPLESLQLKVHGRVGALHQSCLCVSEHSMSMACTKNDNSSHAVILHPFASASSSRPCFIRIQCKCEMAEPLQLRVRRIA